MSSTLRIGIVSMSVVLTVAFSPAFAQASSKTVVPGRSIAGVQIGMTEAQVTQRLGQPSDKGDASVRQPVWSYPRLGLVVYFTKRGGGAVYWIRAVRYLKGKPRYSTSKGVAMGSTVPQVKRVYPNLQCGVVKEGGENTRLGEVVEGDLVSQCSSGKVVKLGGLRYCRRFTLEFKPVFETTPLSKRRVIEFSLQETRLAQREGCPV